MSLIIEKQRYSKNFDVVGFATTLSKDMREWVPHSETSPKLNFSDLRIWTRDNPPQFIQFDRNAVQNMLLASLCEEHGCDPARPWELKGLKTNCLKARQMGMSTFWLSLWYQKFYNLDYSQIIVLTHRAESTFRLWQTVETWEQDCRRTLSWMPKLRYSNRKELVREDTGSSILIATAGMEDVATSGMITDVHRSETGLWKPGAEDQIVGILGALPAWGNLIEESTARGYNAHKRRWDAQERDRTAYFFPFTDMAEYRSAPPMDFERTAEEAKLRSVRILAGRRSEEPVSDESVWWRRLKHAQFSGQGKPEETLQEFPLSPEEAFFASASDAYYPTAYIIALLEEFADARPVEVIEPGTRGFGGRIEIWEEKQEGVSYAFGGDESDGFKDLIHDDSASDGFRCDTLEQVIAYTGRPDGERFAYDLIGLSAHYNDATLVVERPPMGGTTLNKLIDSGANLYRHNKGAETAPERTKYGFPAGAKDLRDGALKGALCRAAAYWEQYREEGLTASDAAREVRCPVIKSRVTLEQILHYSELENGKRGGKGSHDDHVTACGVVTWWMDAFVTQYAYQDFVPENRRVAYSSVWDELRGR